MQKDEFIFIRILVVCMLTSLLSIILLANLIPAINQGKDIHQIDMLEVSSNKNDSGLVKVQEKIPVSKTIYWALQDNDKDSINETLVISNNSVSGNESGSFSGNNKINSSLDVPWVKTKNLDTTSNLSLNVTTVKIKGLVATSSTSYWFSGVGLNSKTFTADLSNLNVSNVSDMKSMFEYTAHASTTFKVEGLSTWNISNVIDMSYMFYHAGQNATTFIVNGISDWDTSNVTKMTGMFSYSGFSKRN